MVELTPGSQVFVYQSHLHQVVARTSYKSAASFLLNCFYTNDELVGMNLTGGMMMTNMSARSLGRDCSSPGKKGGKM